MVESTGHNIKIFNRKRVEIDGVQDVKSFDERQVCLLTVRGEMVLDGDGFQIEKLDIDAGAVHIAGEVLSIRYVLEEAATNRGFFSRLFS